MSKETIQQLIERHVIDNNGQWSHETDEAWILAGQGQFKITREEFNAAADRMRGKPDWSEVLSKHPDAQYLAQWPGDTGVGTGANVGLWISYDRMPECEGGYLVDEAHEVFHHNKGSLIGDWRNTLEKRPEQKVETVGEAISIAMTNAANKMASDLRDVVNSAAPAKPWFEAGDAPPAGTYCQVKQKNEFVNCYIVGLDDCGAIVYRIDGFYGAKMDQNSFRPIRTEREKAIDAAVKVCTGVNIATTTDGLTMKTLNKLYDAGLLRLPDNKKPD